MLERQLLPAVQARRLPSGVVDRFATLDIADRPLHEVMHDVARLAASTVPGVDQASVTLIDVADKTRSVVFTGSLAVTLDERQYDVGFGPCVAAAQSGDVVRIDDTTTEETFQAFAAVARRAGVSSVLALPLPMPARVLGALGLHRVDAGHPLDAEAEAAAASFAVYAGVALANASKLANQERLTTHLQTAMRSREVIDQAKGILMDRTGCDADAAFRVLAKQSQDSNRKLRDLASEIVTAATQRSSQDRL